jgi:hypothetical protein
MPKRCRHERRQAVTGFSTLLAGIRQAVLDGQTLPPTPTAASSGRAFAEPFGRAVRAQLSDGEWTAFTGLLDGQDRALKAAQAGRLDQAAIGFAALRTDHAGRSASPLFEALGEIFIGAAEAYLMYRRADYGAAERLIRHASLLDQVLIDRHGLSLMSAHRLQLGHNLMRIDARRGRQREAVDLAADFMAYLDWEDDVLPVDLASPRRQLDAVPPSVVGHYFDRLCSEAAMVLAGRFDADARSMFTRLAPHANRQGNAISAHCGEARAWLACKTLALAGNPGPFLAEATTILAAGRQSEPLFWFATVLDVAGHCRTLGAEGSDTAAWLVERTHRMEGAPFALKKLVEAENA